MLRHDHWSYGTVFPSILCLLHVDLSAIEVGSVEVQRLPYRAIGNVNEGHTFVSEGSCTNLEIYLSPFLASFGSDELLHLIAHCQNQPILFFSNSSRIWSSDVE